jgi:CSLREA domain-containing protein
MSRGNRRIIGRGRIFAAALVGMIALLAAAGAQAQTITVNDASDPGSGSTCTLREAITLANGGTTGIGTCAAIPAGGPPFTIIFNIPGSGPFTITLTSGSLQTSKSMSIIGGTTPATGIAISGNNSSQVFQVFAGTLTLQYLTLENGLGTEDGGAIQVTVNTHAIVSDCTFVDNTVADSTGFVAFGGALSVGQGGSLTVTNSTFLGNQASETGLTGLRFAAGGAIFGNSGSTLTVTNCTFWNNQVTSTNSASGGNVFINGTGRIIGTLNLKGNIIANSTPENCGTGSTAIVNDNGYNIADDTANSCKLVLTPSGTSQVITPTSAIGLASALGNNGGPTQTLALNGTPANTFIPAAECTDQSGDPLTTDQRGFVRPINGTCSAGAYQFASALPIDCTTAFASNPNLTAVVPVFASEYVFGVSNQARPYNLKITGVTQDKPVPAFPLCPNAFWNGTTAYVRVTNEPLQPGPSGLLYEIEFSATDTASGVICTGAVPVCVQGILNSGKQCLAPLDASYDATKCP